MEHALLDRHPHGADENARAHEEQQRVHLVATTQLESLGVTEEQRAEGGADRHPVTEDHRGETDVAAATRLALLESVGRDHREEATAETGETTGDDDGDRLVEVHVDAEGLGRLRRLTTAAQAQTERGLPQDEDRADDEADGEQREQRDVLRQTGEDAGDIGDEEPVVLLDVDESARPGKGDARDVRQARALGGATAGQFGEEALGEELRQARTEQVDGHTGDDVVDAEEHGGDGVEQAEEHAAEDAAEHAGPRAVVVGREGSAPRAHDHHALETDVDHTGPLGPQTTETGEGQRHSGHEGRRDGVRGVDVVDAGGDAKDRQAENDGDERERKERLARQPERPLRLGCGSSDGAHAVAPAVLPAASSAATRRASMRLSQRRTSSYAMTTASTMTPWMMLTREALTPALICSAFD